MSKSTYHWKKYGSKSNYKLHTPKPPNRHLRYHVVPLPCVHPWSQIPHPNIHREATRRELTNHKSRVYTGKP